LAAGASFSETFPPVPALKPMPPAFLSAPGQVLEVQNMPEGMTQGGLPICYGVTAWHLYQQHVCKEKHLDCKQLDPKQTPSPLAIAAIGISRTFTEKYPGTQAIPFNTGGRLSASLGALGGMDDIYADACYPWARFAEKYREDDRAMWQAFDKLRSNFYDKYRAEGQTCIPCLQDTLKRDFDLAASQEKLEAALKEIVFERFLFDIFLKGCKDKVAIGEFYESGWPGGSDSTYAGFINTLKRVLSANTPASVGFCADVKTAAIPKGQDCNHPHIVTVFGYRQVCSQGSCTDYLRVLNSWGKGWQTANSDGWIDARNFYDYLDRGGVSVEWIAASASGAPR
jgi:hypothetical protein